MTKTPQSSGTDVSPAKIPPLSDALSRLISLSAADRLDARTFELLALKDPAAVARLISLSNSVAFSRGTQTTTVKEAVRTIGTQTAYDALLAIFMIDLADMPGHLKNVQTFLTRHIFSMVATARRVTAALPGASEAIDHTHLALATILDKLGVALALVRPDTPVLPAIQEAMRDDRHLLHMMPPLEDGFRFSVRVAEHWGLGSALVADVRTLAEGPARAQDGNATVQVVLASEALLDAKKGLGSQALVAAPFNGWPVLQALLKESRDPMTLVAAW